MNHRWELEENLEICFPSHILEIRKMNPRDINWPHSKYKPPSLIKLYTILYTKNKLIKKEILKSHLQCNQKMKYLEINLTKEVKDLYNENCKL